MLPERHLGTMGRAFKAPSLSRGSGAAWGTPLWSAAEVVRYGHFDCSRNPGFAEFY
jgi:hypothetical protein